MPEETSETGSSAGVAVEFKDPQEAKKQEVGQILDKAKPFFDKVKTGLSQLRSETVDLHQLELGKSIGVLAIAGREDNTADRFLGMILTKLETGQIKVDICARTFDDAPYRFEGKSPVLETDPEEIFSNPDLLDPQKAARAKETESANASSRFWETLTTTGTGYLLTGQAEFSLSPEEVVIKPVREPMPGGRYGGTFIVAPDSAAEQGILRPPEAGEAFELKMTLPPEIKEFSDRVFNQGKGDSAILACGPIPS